MGQHDDSVIALFAIFCIFGLPVVGWIAIRTFRFLERMEMIKHGMVPPPESGFWGFGRRRAWREWSAQQRQQQQQVQWGAAGRPHDPLIDDEPQQALFKGIRLALIGLALFIGLSFVGGTPGTPDFRYGPWLLGGLVPMFVGIAQIIVAVLSGAQLPGVTGRGTFVPPPPPPPGPGTPPPPPPGSAAWQQPGRPRFEELSKPTPPPDLR